MAGTDYEHICESLLEDHEDDEDSAINVTDSDFLKNIQIGNYNQQIIRGSLNSCSEHSTTENCLHCSHESLLESVDDIKNELKNKRSSCNDDQLNLRKVLERVNSLSRGIKHLHHQMENFTAEVTNCRKDIDDIQKNLKGSNCDSEIIKKVESVNKAMGKLEDKCVREYEHTFNESSKQDKKKGLIKRMRHKVKKAFTKKSNKYNFRSASTVDCSRISLLDAASEDEFGSYELTTEHDDTVDSGFYSNLPYHSMDCLSFGQYVQQTVQYETTV